MEKKIVQVATWLAEKKGLDITALDVRGHSPLTEAMIFVTAGSARHAQALAEEVMHRLAEHHWEYFGVEGLQTGQWVLVDCNDILVHIFQPDIRNLYHIEGLYSKATPVELPQSARGTGEEA